MHSAAALPAVGAEPGAVTGALARARFGARALPDRWIDTVEVSDDLRSLADALLEREIDPR